MEEIDLKELFQIFWDKKIHIIIITLIFAVLGVIYTLTFVEPKYQASTTLLLAVDSSSEKVTAETITTTDVTLNSNLVSTYSELVKSNKIIRTVISNLELDMTEEAVRKSVKVTAVSDTEVIKISVQNEDPVQAAKIANEIANVFIDTIKEFYGIENVHVVDEAEIEEEPCNVNHPKDVVIFTFIGVVVAGMYVFIDYMLDTSVKSIEDIERMIGVRVLAAIPIYEGALESANRKKRGAKK